MFEYNVTWGGRVYSGDVGKHYMNDGKHYMNDGKHYMNDGKHDINDGKHYMNDGRIEANNFISRHCLLGERWMG